MNSFEPAQCIRYWIQTIFFPTCNMWNMLQ
jgi:hypothetical protein